MTIQNKAKEIRKEIERMRKGKEPYSRDIIAKSQGFLMALDEVENQLNKSMTGIMIDRKGDYVHCQNVLHNLNSIRKEISSAREEIKTK